MRQRPLVHRYAPFLVLLALLGVLMVLEPSKAPSEEAVAGGGTVAAGGGTGAVGSDGVALDAGTGTGDAATGTVDGGTSSAGGGTTGGGGGGTGTAAAGTTGSGQRVDALGRPLDGDKGKCAPGGLLQENVTSFSLPCIPKFTGDNGGATYQGVTKDEVKVVVLAAHYEPAVQAALTAVGLAATDQQHAEASNVFAQFINKRYELYNRKIKAVVVSTDCVTGDDPCYRADAKAMLARHKPFAVVWAVPGIAPPSFMDEVARARVIGLGAPGLPTEWFKARRPYMWTEVPQSPASTDLISDYYCKKMYGKNATLAGDPRMRLERRRLGIIVTEIPENIEAAKRVFENVTGRMCGSKSDGTQLYTIAANTDEADAQRPTLISRMKNDGINVSLQLPSTDVLGCNACDQAQYYPENLISGQNQNDADIVGRLDASAQRTNRFGIGMRPLATPLPDHDFRRASRDVNPGYEPPYITEGDYLALAMIGRMVQLAGPRLTPQTVEAGAHGMVQLGGFVNLRPWNGWKCCDPKVPKWMLGDGPDDFSAWSDAREIYWDDTAISPDDGRPGAWVCVQPCKRYEAGQWPKGEPKQGG
jgi:hypothetical protein